MSADTTGPTTSREPAALLDHLNAQRRHVLGILEGLDDEALRRPVLPSGWSCLAMVRHLALDDERFWFRGVVAADPEVIADVTDHQDEDGWRLPADARGSDVLDLYRREAELSDAVLRSVSLGAEPAWWPERLMGPRWADDVRDIVLHVITETATHAGHLDAVRELIDGRQWRVLAG